MQRYFLVAGFTGNLSGLAGYLTPLVGTVLMGYFLYRSARSLVPLNRITVEEMMIQPAKPT